VYFDSAAKYEAQKDHKLSLSKYQNGNFINTEAHRFCFYSKPEFLRAGKLITRVGNIKEDNPIYRPDTLILAVHPYLTFRELRKRFTPLAKYLSQEIEQPVVIRVGSSYQEHIANIGKDKVDIAFIGPAGYIKLVEEYGKKPLLASIETNGTPFYYGKIVIRADSPIKNLLELAKGDVAFVDPNSTMGYLVPLYMFLETGGIKDVLRHSKFLGSHNNVALGVLTGDFDGGAVKEEVYEAYKKEGLKVLETTPPIPEHLFITRSNLSLNIIHRLRKALYKLKDNEYGRQIMKSIKPTITGMRRVENADYDSLRKIIKKLEKAGLIK